MNVKAIAFLSLIAFSTLSTPAFSQTPEIDISKVPTMRIRDWRNPSGFTPPWSTPVLIDDEFDGTYLAVFDRNYQKAGGFFGFGSDSVEHGFQSIWSDKMVRAFYYTKTSGGDTLREISDLAIKVGGKVYKLKGDKGNFPMTPELAYALKTAPLEVAMIRAEFKDSGVPYSSDIGIGTVTSWRAVYQKAKDPSQVSSTQSTEVTPMLATGNKPKAKAKRK
jgi:hypothetical protein